MRGLRQLREASIRGAYAGRTADLSLPLRHHEADWEARSAAHAKEIAKTSTAGRWIALLGGVICAAGLAFLAGGSTAAPAMLTIGGLAIFIGLMVGTTTFMLTIGDPTDVDLRKCYVEAARDAFLVREPERPLSGSTPFPAPDPQPFGVSHEGAEHLCAAWMRHLGATDAHVTRYSSDGGIDIESRAFVAQVKNYAGSVPVGDIRALFGVATAEGKTPILLTSGTLTQDGYTFADRVGIIALHYDAIDGTIRGLNEPGAFAVRNGLPGT